MTPLTVVVPMLFILACSWWCSPQRFPGGTEYMITADVQLMPSTSQKAWNRPPIQVGTTYHPHLRVTLLSLRP